MGGKEENKYVCRRRRREETNDTKVSHGVNLVGTGLKAGRGDEKKFGWMGLVERGGRKRFSPNPNLSLSLALRRYRMTVRPAPSFGQGWLGGM